MKIILPFLYNHIKTYLCTIIISILTIIINISIEFKLKTRKIVIKHKILSLNCEKRSTYNAKNSQQNKNHFSLSS